MRFVYILVELAIFPVARRKQVGVPESLRLGDELHSSEVRVLVVVARKELVHEPRLSAHHDGSSVHATPPLSSSAMKEVPWVLGMSASRHSSASRSRISTLPAELTL